MHTPSYNESVATRVRSFCKINLGLAVGPIRPDGFHNLTTCYQTLALHDFVTVTAKRASSTRIVLETDHPGVPSTARGDAERNTACKMVAGALEQLGLHAEVHIELEKRLPVQGGLGAGSANAVAALLGLERELGAALPGPDRLALAASVGSDVPLFLLGGTVLGLHRGEAVYPLPDSAALPVIVAVPPVGVSTAQAFRDLDAPMLDGGQLQSGAGLTENPSPDRLEMLSRVLASLWTSTGAGRVATGIANSPPYPPAGQGCLPSGSNASEGLHGDPSDLAESPGSPSRLRVGVVNPILALVRTGVENDFESVAFRQHPSLRDIKRLLTGSRETEASQALYAALSGSGSALFGIYGSAEAAREAQQRVQVSGTRAFLTETLSRQEYWQRMFA